MAKSFKESLSSFFTPIKEGIKKGWSDWKNPESNSGASTTSSKPEKELSDKLASLNITPELISPEVKPITQTAQGWAQSFVLGDYKQDPYSGQIMKDVYENKAKLDNYYLYANKKLKEWNSNTKGAYSDRLSQLKSRLAMQGMAGFSPVNLSKAMAEMDDIISDAARTVEHQKDYTQKITKLRTQEYDSPENQKMLVSYLNPSSNEGDPEIKKRWEEFKKVSDENKSFTPQDIKMGKDVLEFRDNNPQLFQLKPNDDTDIKKQFSQLVNTSAPINEYPTTFIGEDGRTYTNISKGRENEPLNKLTRELYLNQKNANKWQKDKERLGIKTEYGQNDDLENFKKMYASDYYGKTYIGNKIGGKGSGSGFGWGYTKPDMSDLNPVNSILELSLSTSNKTTTDPKTKTTTTESIPENKQYRSIYTITAPTDTKKSTFNGTIPSGMVNTMTGELYKGIAGKSAEMQLNKIEFLPIGTGKNGTKKGKILDVNEIKNLKKGTDFKYEPYVFANMTNYEPKADEGITTATSSGGGIQSTQTYSGKYFDANKGNNTFMGNAFRYQDIIKAVMGNDAFNKLEKMSVRFNEDKGNF